MNIQNIVISAVAVVALVLGGLAYTKNTASPAPTQQFGSITGPVVNYPYFSIGGSLTYFTGRSLAQGTSTLCYTQLPLATTTLQASQLKMTVSSSTALTVQIGYGAVLGTETTVIGGTYHIAANAQAFIQASTSPAAGAATVIPPSSTSTPEYLQWVNTTTGAGVNDAEQGTCQIELLSS